ncbi:uncharacterized protein EAE98_010390 [Botrytis deweyae]|uniref:2EXR domain-containing protein n=2 Tax=Botrytis TaxID=33196 RepID=A0A4Z1K6G6_9HELO|nr:uncharacterized protein EAE98_010390 [Botrytis deweyae]KAF7916959.1 hypothetical protein EAE98_010390 [Botrytis deweyae]KAF7927253.1 hypothetical protein EAE99_005584 [Botrytis elliptica]TGO76923.1 hypothetical protein BELL_0131g00140 [Botrytis elliptica]
MSANNGISTIHDTVTNKDVPFSRRFPADIESMIFEEACYNERVVWIRESRFKVAIDSGYRSLYRFRSNQPVPAIMHVNANAREIALRHYKAGFAAEKNFNKLDPPEIENHRIYLNPASDIVWPVDSVSSHFVKSLRDLNVETIAIDIFPMLNILRGYFNYALCPRNGSHKAGWVERDTEATNLWIHDQPTELFCGSYISILHGSSEFGLPYCCDAMRCSTNLVRELAATHSRQVRKNHYKGNEGTRAQRLPQCPEWLFERSGNWQRPRNKFLLHWR